MKENQLFPWQSLMAWYSTFARSFPWRHISHLSPADRGYRILLSEIFSQQTQIDRVVGFYERVLSAYPTIFDLANATYDDFFPYYKGLGYYSRAKNLLSTARLLVAEHDGILPQDPSLLQKYPGIWPYTARSLVAFTYSLPYLALDTNLKKIFSRYFFGSRFAQLGGHLISQLEHEMAELHLDGNTVNNALMDFASQVTDAEAASSSLSLLPGCAFALDGGKKEKHQEQLQIASKKKALEPKNPGQLFVIIHDSHKMYLSPEKAWRPFIFPKTADYREKIGAYFEKTYGLSLSVRPPKIVTIAAVPSWVCFCQIQAGTHVFYVHTKAEFSSYKDGKASLK